MTKNNVLTLKKLGVWIWSPSDFPKTIYSREGVTPCFFETFNIIIRHIFPETFNEIYQLVRELWRFSSRILTNLIIFMIFFFLVANKVMTQHITDDVSIYFSLNRLFNECTKLFWHWISFSWNIKDEGVIGGGGVVKLTSLRRSHLSRSPALFGLKLY